MPATTLAALTKIRAAIQEQLKTTEYPTWRMDEKHKGYPTFFRRQVVAVLGLAKEKPGEVNVGLQRLPLEILAETLEFAADGTKVEAALAAPDDCACLGQDVVYHEVAAVKERLNQAEKKAQAGDDDAELLALLTTPVLVCDKSRRLILGTAYQLALGAGDTGLPPPNQEGLADFIKSKFASLKSVDGIKLSQKQYDKQFPNGVREEPSREVKRCIDEVKLAIEKANPDRPEEDDEVNLTVKNLRDALKPTHIISTGLHFNPELLTYAREILNDEVKRYLRNNTEMGRWSPKQLDLFLLRVESYLQRVYLPAVDAQVFCDGVDDIISGGVLELNSELTVRGVGPFYPDNLDQILDGSDSLLFGVDDFGGAVWVGFGGPLRWAPLNEGFATKFQGLSRLDDSVSLDVPRLDQNQVRLM